MPRISVGGAWTSLRGALAAHPGRAAGFAALGVILLLFVGTTSLPLALAPGSPRLALLLSPGNPYALDQVAGDDRRRLTALLTPPPSDPKVTPDSKAAPDAKAGRSTPAARGAEPPADEPSPTTITEGVDPVAEIQRLRTDIRERAARALLSAPLDAAAYRLLGETEETPAAATETLANAFALSRREPVAALWLLNEAYQRRAYADVMQKADALLRTTPALNSYVFGYLYAMIPDPEARAALVEALKARPPWRAAFLQSLGDKVNSDDGVELFLALKADGAPASAPEIIPYLQARLFNAKDPQGSYNIWLQLLSVEELAKLLPVNNANFASDPSGAPFDWRIGRGSNVVVRLARLKDEPQARAIRVEFGIGRVRFGGVTQVVFLRPGSYVFEGQQMGTMSAKRGMVWEVRCFPKNDMLGQSGQLFGSRRTWQDFDFQFTVPDLGCQTQIIRLLHDSRSASEEYASGEILFSKIRVSPAPPPDADTVSTRPATRSK